MFQKGIERLAENKMGNVAIVCPNKWIQIHGNCSFIDLLLTMRPCRWNELQDPSRCAMNRCKWLQRWAVQQ